MSRLLPFLLCLAVCGTVNGQHHSQHRRQRLTRAQVRERASIDCALHNSTCNDTEDILLGRKPAPPEVRRAIDRTLHNTSPDLVDLGRQSFRNGFSVGYLYGYLAMGFEAAKNNDERLYYARKLLKGREDGDIPTDWTHIAWRKVEYAAAHNGEIERVTDGRSSTHGLFIYPVPKRGCPKDFALRYVVGYRSYVRALLEGSGADTEVCEFKGASMEVYQRPDWRQVLLGSMETR